MTDTVKSWIKERRAIHAKATPGVWEEDAVSGLEGCIYLADSSYECVADAMSTDDAGPIVDAHNMFPRALDALEQAIELHKPVGNQSWRKGPVCQTCIGPAYGHAEWPCPTVQSIEGAINHE